MSAQSPAEKKKDKTVSLTLKLALYLFARVILVILLSFMSIPIGNIYHQVTWPILGIFYFIVLFYFFCFTCHYEGMSDQNRVETGLIREQKEKGLIASAIVVVPMLVIGLIPFLYGYDSSVPVCRVCLIIYYIFSMSTSYAAQSVVGLDTSELSAELDIGRMQGRFAVFAAIYLICVIGATVAYRLGYEGKHPFKPLSDKLASWSK